MQTKSSKELDIDQAQKTAEQRKRRITIFQASKPQSLTDQLDDLLEQRGRHAQEHPRLDASNYEAKKAIWNAKNDELVTRIKLLEQQITMQVQQPPGVNIIERKLKVHKGIESIPMFTPKLARSVPYPIWFNKYFVPEMILRGCDSEEMLLNLKNYVSSTCWKEIHGVLSQEALANLDDVNRSLGSVYGEKLTHIELVNNFNSYTQTVDDVMQYHRRKSELFTRAYPKMENYERSVDFRHGWLKGVYEPFALKIAENPDYLTCNFNEWLELCLRKEQALKRIHGTYGDKQGIKPRRHEHAPDQSTPDKKVNKQKVKRRTPDDAKSPTRKPSKDDKKTQSQPNEKLRKKCRRSDCGKPEHPYFACPKLTCKACNGAQHSYLLCPKLKCTICGQQGHDVRTHGFDPKQHF